MQLASTDHLQLLGRVRVFDAQRDVAEQLLFEPVAQVARGDVLPVPAGHGRRVDPEDHRHRRLVDRDRWNPHVVLGIADRFADGDALDAGEADDVAGGGLVDLHALQAIEGKQLGDLRQLNGPTELQHRHRAVQLHGAVEHAADRDPSEIVARVQIGHQDLQRRRGIALGWRHRLDDGVEQRSKAVARLGQIRRRDTIAGVRIQHRKFDLVLGRVEVDEQVVDLVQHLLGPGVGAVDLVQHDDRRQPALERLAQHETRLRQRALGRIDQQHHAIDHRQRALDFPAEVGVSWRIDDVDQEVVVMDGGVLGEDGDATLALQVGVVHDPVGDLLIGAERSALPQQAIDQRRLAVVHVRDDGHVPAKRVGDLLRFSVSRHLTSITGRRERCFDGRWVRTITPLMARSGYRVLVRLVCRMSVRRVLQL